MATRKVEIRLSDAAPLPPSSRCWCHNALRAFGPYLTGEERAFLQMNEGEELDPVIARPRFVEIMRRVSAELVGEELDVDPSFETLADVVAGERLRPKNRP